MNCEPATEACGVAVTSPTGRSRRLTLMLGLGLGLITLCAFFGVWKNGFVDYDDNTYVFRNPQIASGLSWQTITWAFTYVNACHWVPMTWLSHALDCQLYGLNPAGHHITSLLLHAANAILLLLTLRRLTGATWRSALVAALFAVHPLRTESVAWVAERKDVLSGLFFMLTLWAYVRYACRDQTTKGDLCASSDETHRTSLEGRRIENRKSKIKNYILALLFFALGLMSKSMLVTMPFLFLLLDWWPLGRLRLTGAGNPGGAPHSPWEPILPLLREKIPFFVLSSLACLITYLAQDTTAANIGTLPVQQRWANGILACIAYLKDTIWPHHLAVFYPPQAVSLPDMSVLASFAVLVVLTLAAVFLARKHRFVLVGWFWFLGVLVPVSGLVQVGAMVQADRFTYLPSIGLYLVVAWAAAAAVQAWPRLKPAVVVSMMVVLAALAFVTHALVPVWRSTHTLFAHAAEVTRDNYVALTMLAKDELDENRAAEATANLEHILKLAPRFPNAEYLLGTALQMQGRMAEAIPHLEAAVGPEVGMPAKARLVLSLLDSGRLPEAEALLDPLVRANPGDPNGWLMAAALLKEQGHSAEAVRLFQQVISQNPQFLLDTPTMNYELAELYSLAGNTPAAVPFYRKAIEISPQFTNALNNFAWLLATDPNDKVRDGKKAVEMAERACNLADWKQPVFIGTLAAAYAEAGRFEEAATTAERARSLAQTSGFEVLAKKNAELLELYRHHKPYREKAGG